MEIKHTIGQEFYTINQDAHQSERKKRKNIIIGFYYIGAQSFSKWKSMDQMLENMILMIQIAIEGHFTFSEWSNYDLRYDKFLAEIEKDKKLLPQYREYEDI